MLLTSMWYCMMGVQLMVSSSGLIHEAGYTILKLTHCRSAA